MRYFFRIFYIFILYMCICACTGDTPKPPTSSVQENDFTKAALQSVQDSMQLDQVVFERVSEIMHKYENETKATKQQQFNNPKSKKQVMQNLLKSRRTELGDVLKPRQVITFNKLYKEGLANERKRAQAQKQLSEEDRKALGEKIQAYRLESVMPVLKEQRIALEAAMSPTDKTQIAGIREKVAAFNQSVKDKKAACAAIDQTEKKAKMTCRRELKAIQKKGNEPIKKEIEELIKLLEEKPGTQAIMTEMDAQRDKWRADLKKMLDMYSEKKVDAEKVPLGKYFRLVQPTPFLMLDPAKVRERDS